MEKVIEYLQRAFSVLKNANIVFPTEATVNIYHHCGVQNFFKVGATFINIVNRDYCKSYVIMLPNQKYPCHFHKIKSETFYVLYGILNVKLNNKLYILQAGDMLNVERGEDHMFWSEGEVVFEEISTLYIPNDSFYTDPDIREVTYAQRRTTISPAEWKEICKQWKG